jgi:Ca-activated chloride channel family protein
MEFGNIWILLHLFWVLPLGGVCVYFAFSKRKSIMKLLFGKNYDMPQYSTVSKTKRYIKIWLFLFAVCFLFVALAKPRWGWKILPYSGKGRDLMILLDVSKSMNAEDVKPSRLKHAKFFLRNLIKQSPGDRFGLIAFAGSAFLECPLTVDKTSLFQSLDDMNTNTIPLGGTNIEKALTTAIEAFKAAEGGHRAIILITDGDEIDGNSSRAIEKLNEMKIPLFIVGIGDPVGSGLIQTTDEQGNKVLLRDRQGKLVKSHLKEATLKLLKDKTNGIYVRSIETNSGLKPILKRIKALVPKGFENGYNKRPIERFQYPLFVAVLLLLCVLGISETRKNRGDNKIIQSLSLIFIFFCLGNILNAQQVQPIGNQLKNLTPQSLQLEDNIENTEKSKEQDPILAKAEQLTDPVELYNEALKLQQNKNPEGAAILYKKAISLSDKMPEVRGKSFQNLGVISHSQARQNIYQDPDKALEILDKAETLYRESMRSDSYLKKVVLNQQRLLDDRLIAKKIKEQKEKMKKQQDEAAKKTKEALKQQQKENKQKNKQNKKNKQENQKNKKQQEKNKQQNQKKQQQDKNKQQDKKESKNQNSEKQKTDQKIKDAKKAVSDLKKQAQKLKDKKTEKQASDAEKELQKAQEEHKKGDGDKSEEHIKKALNKVKPKEKKCEKKDQKNKNSKGQQGQKSKKEDKKQQDKQKQNKGKDLERSNPKDKKIKDQDAEKGKDVKDIDPRQAEALLKMMAGDEKKLRDKLKEIQKRQSRTRKPLKDW